MLKIKNMKIENLTSGNSSKEDDIHSRRLGSEHMCAHCRQVKKV